MFGQPGSEDGGLYPGELLFAKDRLYGTTTGGGMPVDDDPSAGYGTVFSLSASGGTPTPVTAFTPGTTGYQPNPSLAFRRDTLYGDTTAGADNGYGAVFAVSTGGRSRLRSREFSPE